MRICSYVVFISLDVLEVQGDRILPGVGLIYIADAMRRQVDLAILVTL